MRAAAILLLLLVGCQAGSGRVEWVRETYYESGKKESSETVTVQQNENPKEPTTVTVSDGRTVTIGSSHEPQKMDIGAINSRRDLTYAGIAALTLAALLAAFGQHWRLASIGAATGLGLIAIGATIDRYAWAYGLGIFAAAVAGGAYLWSRYKERQKNEGK